MEVVCVLYVCCMCVRHGPHASQARWLHGFRPGVCREMSEVISRYLLLGSLEVQQDLLGIGQVLCV